MTDLNPRQEDEIEALKSICGDENVRVTKRHDGHIIVTISVPISWPDEKTVIVHAIDSDSRVEQLQVKHLPPMSLQAVLPPGYLSSLDGLERESRPKVSLTSCIPGQLPRLQRVIDSSGGDECLFDLVQALDTDQLDLEWPLHITADAQSIRQHDAQLRTSSFEATKYDCAICFEQKRGTKCASLDCGDVFCVECLRDFFVLLIKEGLVLSIKCPSTDCPARDTQVSVEKIRQVTQDESLAKRYESLLAKIQTESDPTIAFCPRDQCQAPVPRPAQRSDSDPEADETKLRVCPKCAYAFCVFCKRAWHGTANACALPASSALVSKYLEASEADKRALERQYGTTLLRKLVKQYVEERAASEWISANTTACPACRKPVEKSEGCNHMTCARCQTHYCHRCGAHISAQDPYKHFSTPGAPCYNKLFDFIPTGGGGAFLLNENEAGHDIEGAQDMPEFRIEEWIDPDDVAELLLNMDILTS